jgi:transcriptional regulator with XRE-family HTH domain
METGSVGARIRNCRENLGMTQSTLAQKTGLSNGFLSDIENDKRNATTQNLMKIANVIGSSLDYLMLGDERKLGRPANGKRSDPDFGPFQFLLNKMTVRAVRRTVEDMDNNQDVSDLVQTLLANWLKRQERKENTNDTNLNTNSAA